MGLSREARLAPDEQLATRAALSLAWSHGVHTRALAVAVGCAQSLLSRLRRGAVGVSPARAARLLRVLAGAPEAWFGHGRDRNREAETMRSLDALTLELRVINGQLVQLDRQRQEVLRRFEAVTNEVLEAMSEVARLKEAVGHPSKPFEGL